MEHEQLWPVRRNADLNAEISFEVFRNFDLRNAFVVGVVFVLDYQLLDFSPIEVFTASVQEELYRLDVVELLQDEGHRTDARRKHAHSAT